MDKQKINQKSLSIESKATESKKLSVFLAEYVTSNNIPANAHDDLRLVMEEAFINIVNYAFTTNMATDTTTAIASNTTITEAETHIIDIEISNTIKTVSITFIDSGIAFNPLVDCKKIIDNDNLCEGGMGIHLIKSLTDHQEYNRIKQRNVFTVTKHYTQ